MMGSFLVPMVISNRCCISSLLFFILSLNEKEMATSKF
jgi:hypothetical protein